MPATASSRPWPWTRRSARSADVVAALWPDRRQAGYEKYRREFSKVIWQLASPK
jgi:hypothetical protein